MIPINEYMCTYDVDSKVKFNTPIRINGDEYIVVPWHCNILKHVIIKDAFVIKEIFGYQHPTYEDILHHLNIDIVGKYLSVGDVIYNKLIGEYYIIAREDNDKFNIISLHDGNRWSKPHLVNDIYAITYNEFYDMVGGDMTRFFYVGKSRNVIEVKEC